MSQKRLASEVLDDDGKFKQPKQDEHVKKHTLDSDEEDSGDDDKYQN